MKRAQRWSLILGLTVILSGTGVLQLDAGAKPRVFSVRASCRAQTAEVESMLASKTGVENLTVYVVCREPDWLRLRQKMGFPGTVEAFTYLGKPITLVGPQAFETRVHLSIVLDHELRHVRCGCDLGEVGF